MTDNLRDMDGPELVRTFNELAMSETGKELKIKTVQRFKDRDTGIKRIETLQSSIRAREQGLNGQDTEEEEAEEEQAPTGQKAFKFRKGSDREEFLKVLFAHLNAQVPKEDLGDKVSNMIRHVKHVISKNHLPYTILKEGDSYGLYDAD